MEKWKPDESWTDWGMGSYYGNPPHGVLLKWRRREWDYFVLAYVEDFNNYPEMNIAGLYWQLTGIGKEQLDNPRIRRRCDCFGSLFFGAQQQPQRKLGNMAGSGLGSLFSGLLGDNLSGMLWGRPVNGHDCEN